METNDHRTHDHDARLPTISVCMATLNAATVVEECLRRLRSQDYPPHLIELIVADGGSTDATVAIVERHGGRVLPNPLKTGEAGKAEAVRAAGNDLIVMLDSDNWLPGSDWLQSMVKPFADPQIALAEPIEYTWCACFLGRDFSGIAGAGLSGTKRRLVAYPASGLFRNHSPSHRRVFQCPAWSSHGALQALSKTRLGAGDGKFSRQTGA